VVRAREKLAALSLALATVVFAADAQALEVEGARALSVGGALRARGSSNSSIHLNPANLAISRMYHVESLYVSVPTNNGHLAGGSVVDSMTSQLAAGLGFNYQAWDPDGEHRNEYDVRLSLAYHLAQILALGVTVKYAYADREGIGQLPSIMEATGSPLLNTVTVDVGATLTLGSIVNLAVVGYNLTNTGSAFAPLSLGTGASLSLGRSFAVEGDILFDFTTREDMTMQYMAGAEYFVGDSIPLRVGYRYDDNLGVHSVGAGVGYVTPSFGTELGILQDVSGEHLDTSIALSIRYFAN